MKENVGSTNVGVAQLRLKKYYNIYVLAGIYAVESESSRTT